MSLRVVSTLLAFLLAGCFTAAGLPLLGPGARTPGRLNAAFLAGAGLVANALFPASLVFGRRALGVLTVAVLVCGLSGVRFLWPDRDGRAARRPRGSLPRSVAWVAIGIGIATFAALNFRYAFLWDGFQVWASKAMVLHHLGRLPREIWPDPADLARLAEYPNLIPLYGAMVSWLRGAFAFGALKGVFLVFHLSLVTGMVSAGAAVLPPSLALVPAALLVLLPPMTLGFAAGGYADMPMAAVVAGLCAAWLGAGEEIRDRRPSPIARLAATLLTVKLEGLLHLASGLAALVLVRGPRRVPSRETLRANAASIAVVLGAVAVRQGTSLWLGIHDPTYGPLDRAHLVTAFARIPVVVRLCFEEMLRVGSWGLLWPAAAFSVVLLFSVGGERERVLGLGVLLAVIASASPYLLTNWVLEDHIRLSYGRLLSQLAPAACLVVVIAARRAWSSVSEPAGHARDERAEAVGLGGRRTPLP